MKVNFKPSCTMHYYAQDARHGLYVQRAGTEVGLLCRGQERKILEGTIIFRFGL